MSEYLHATIDDMIAKAETRLQTLTAEAERLCVKPYCSPAMTVVSYPAGVTPGALPSSASTPLMQLQPYPHFEYDSVAAAAAAGRPISYPGPKVVLLGCEGCGIPELWRTLVAARPPNGKLQVATVNAGEPRLGLIGPPWSVTRTMMMKLESNDSKSRCAPALVRT